MIQSIIENSPIIIFFFHFNIFPINISSSSNHSYSFSHLLFTLSQLTNSVANIKNKVAIVISAANIDAISKGDGMDSNGD
ncbi:hypothetical protein HMPREF9386_2278 [Streptococcus sanguinis SK330]|uniref:Uncharacterized protein n=1 Tax=Streptococcus sanguinis SK330 TaxID=888813 RepID=F2CAS2_STRSA|nr:hypothetical protein HMPREF9386_2278 [Streptococcus sanguinis SK330]